jgi:hypothetical protein
MDRIKEAEKIARVLERATKLIGCRGPEVENSVPEGITYINWSLGGIMVSDKDFTVFVCQFTPATRECPEDVDVDEVETYTSGYSAATKLMALAFDEWIACACMDVWEPEY